MGDGRSGDTVPVIVWRTIPDTPDTPGHDGRLSARLAHHIVAIYTAIDDTIADFDADDNLRDAAHAARRGYISVSSSGGLAGQYEIAPRAITLIVMRWPRPAPAFSAQAPPLLVACEAVLEVGGSVIVAVTAAAAGHPGATHAEYEQQLVSAARAAGLRHLHDIVALDATDGRDTFTYPATDLNDEGAGTDADAPCHTSITLIVFGKAVGLP